MEPDGLTRWMSSFDRAETLRRLCEAIIDHRMAVFAEIDHAAAASR